MIVTVTPSGGNDTRAIQSAIDSLRWPGNGGVVQLDGGYTVGALDMTKNGPRVTLRGTGLSTTLNAIENMQAVIDLTGSMNSVQELSVRNPGCFTVDCGIMGLQNTALSGNKVLLRDIDIDGKWQFAGLYISGIASSRADNVAVWNRSSHYSAVFASDNFVGFSSDFETTNSGNNLPMSDWTFTQCEFHGNVPSGSTSYGLMLRGARSMRFYGGNVSASGTCYVDLACDGGNRECYALMFDGTTFYSENGTNAAYVFSAAAPAGKTHKIHYLGIDAAYATGFSTGPITTF